MRRLRAWVWRRRMAWKLRDLELPYPYPRNEHEDAMNYVTVQAAIGRPVMSGRADW